MKRIRLSLLLALSLLPSCKENHDPGHKADKGAHADKSDDGHGSENHHGEKEAHSEKEREHEGEIHISQEAIERSGIVVAQAERRALTGGSAIPAEVQFEPSSTAHVGPLVPGRITKVAVKLGDRVKRGQLLGVIASSDVSTARSKLDQSRARLAAAQATLKRQQQLSTEGIGAQRTLIEAEAQVGEIKAEVAGLQQQLSVFGSGSAGALSLTSPIDGVVVALHGTLGETASPDEPAFIVTDPTKVWVQGNVPELELSKVVAGAAVLVRLHAFPDAAMPGTISYVAPALDERTRSLPVRVTLTSPDARLRSGLFGSIELIGGKEDERVLVVPVEAVATIDGQTVVFAAADEPGSFKPLPLALGRRAGGYFEVKAGLEEGTKLAIRGAFTLKSILKSSELSEGDEH